MNTQTEPFLISDEQWKRIERITSRPAPGPERRDDRLVVSGILYVLSNKLPWRACPPTYGPIMTIYNRFNRWCSRGIWQRIYRELTGYQGAELHRASGCVGGKRRRTHPARKARSRRDLVA